MTTGAPRQLLVIDTDGGIDDAVALWWALAEPGDALVEVLAVTTVWGNVDVEVATGNVCRVLHAAARPEVPVARGAVDPWGPAPFIGVPDFIHGRDGLGDTDRPAAPFGAGSDAAVEVLTRIVHERPGEVTVVTLGPLTNLAAAVTADPTWAGDVGRLVIMGGAVGESGNALPAGEANIAHDPVAAEVVLSAAWRTPPLLVGLDVTHAATLTPDELALAREGRTPAARFLAEPMAFYARFGGTFTPGEEFPCHDALAVMAAAIPGLVHGPVLPTAVQATPGPAWGMTVADRRQPHFVRAGQHQALPDGFWPCEVGLVVDHARFRTEVRALLGAG